MHLAETKGEVADCLKKYDKSPIALMEELAYLSWEPLLPIASMLMTRIWKS